MTATTPSAYAADPLQGLLDQEGWRFSALRLPIIWEGDRPMISAGVVESH